MIEINNKKDCCGCSACANACPKNCISMVEDNEGFLYPKVNQDVCINCGLCEKTCSIKNPIEEQANPEQKAALFQHKDARILAESTSGGFFTALSTWILEKGGVVFGAAYDENLVIRHCYIENIEDLKLFRNSKYAQSVIGDCFRQVKDFLNKGRWVCFSGTPCQQEGLHRFLRREYENLVTVDVVCHACPSPLFFKKYLAYYETKNNLKITDVKFRDKEVYGYKYSVMSLSSKDIKFYKEGIDTDIMLRAFFNNLTPRPSCFACPSKKRYHITDFTMWDCFDVDKFSSKLDNDKGVTRILLHTPKAFEIWNNVKCLGNSLEISADSAVAGVRELVHSVPENPKRKEFFADLNSLSTEEVFQKYFPITIRHRLEKQARLWSNRLGIYKIMKKIFRTLNGNREIKR